MALEKMAFLLFILTQETRLEQSYKYGGKNMEMNDFGTTDYGKKETPPGYKCNKCGAANCKMWGSYYALLSLWNLLCANCTLDEFYEEFKIRLTFDKNGNTKKIPSKSIKTNTIGLRTPAIPTAEGDTFWASPPPKARSWWRKLPTYPTPTSK